MARFAGIALVSGILLTAAPADAAQVYGGRLGEEGMAFALTLEAPGDVTAAIGHVSVGVGVECPAPIGSLLVRIDQTMASAFNIGEDDLLASTRGRRFSATGSRDLSFGDLSGLTDVTIRGRRRGTSATGTLSLTVDVFDAAEKQVGTCRTGRLRWSARSSPGRIFAGATSDDQAVVIRLDRRGRRVTDASLGSDLKCGGGTGVFGGNSFAGALRAGRFVDSDRYTLEGLPGRDEFRARIRGARAQGTFRDRRTVEAPDGTPTRCDTGRIRWRARSSPLR